MEKVELRELTQAEKQKEKAAVIREYKEIAKKIAGDRKAYKELVNELVPVMYDRLQWLNIEMAKVKRFVFDTAQGLIDMKSETYGTPADQYTHTFTDSAGHAITVGCREYKNWDDTVTEGLKKINAYLESLIEDPKTARLVGIIRGLLTTDKQGNLNINNVMKLNKHAKELDSPEFTDAVEIILEAHQTTKGKKFVSARRKGVIGNPIYLALDISDVEFEETETPTK